MGSCSNEVAARSRWHIPAKVRVCTCTITKEGLVMMILFSPMRTDALSKLLRTCDCDLMLLAPYQDIISFLRSILRLMHLMSHTVLLVHIGGRG